MPGPFDTEMAVTAVDPHFAGMQFMGIGNGLGRRVPGNPSHRDSHQPGDQDADERYDHHHGQVELDVFVKPIPVRFHSSPSSFDLPDKNDVAEKGK
jgi:hypothetical protein